MENKLPELIGIKELQEYFNCGRDAAYQLLRRKDFPSFFVGRRYYVNKDKLAGWVENECRKKRKSVENRWSNSGSKV